MDRWISYAMILAAALIGGGSLVAFVVFLFAGPFQIFTPVTGDIKALFIDAGLSMLFFIQHSTMIRESFRKKVVSVLPEAYFSAFFAVASGLVLMVAIFTWQKTVCSFAGANDVLYVILRLLFLTAVGGVFWGTRALGFFDPFGIRAIIKHLRFEKTKPALFIVKGPYRWVRHPLYFFTLIMIWTYPHLTADRLLFNILWTIWLVIGSILEERDLVRTFGEQYRKYQSQVPMLIPVKRFYRKFF